MIFGGGNPATADDGNHRPLGADAAVAVRPVDVAAAHRDERDDPAQRQGARDRRIDQRRGRRHGEPERRPVRPGDEHVHFGGSQRLSAPLSFRLAAPSGRDRAAGRGQPARGSYEAAHRDLFAGVPVQRRRHAGAPAGHHRRRRPNAFNYGSAFQVYTPDAASIGSVVLVRPGSPTHAFDMEQRLVGLSLHGGKRCAERDGAAERQHRAARLLHAVRAESAGRAVGRDVRASVGPAPRIRRRLPRLPARRPTSPITGGTVGVVRREPAAIRTEQSAPMPGRSPAALPPRVRCREPGQRDLLDAGDLTARRSRSPTTGG